MGVTQIDVDEPELLALTTILSRNAMLQIKMTHIAQHFAESMRPLVQQINAEKRSNVVLGLRTLGGMPIISDETFSQQELVMHINQKFSEVLKVFDVGHLKWNCIEVMNVSSFS